MKRPRFVAEKVNSEASVRETARNAGGAPHQNNRDRIAVSQTVESSVNAANASRQGEIDAAHKRLLLQLRREEELGKLKRRIEASVCTLKTHAAEEQLLRQMLLEWFVRNGFAASVQTARFLCSEAQCKHDWRNLSPNSTLMLPQTGERVATTGDVFLCAKCGTSHLCRPQICSVMVRCTSFQQFYGCPLTDRMYGNEEESARGHEVLLTSEQLAFYRNHNAHLSLASRALLVKHASPSVSGSYDPLSQDFRSKRSERGYLSHAFEGSQFNRMALGIYGPLGIGNDTKALWTRGEKQPSQQNWVRRVTATCPMTFMRCFESDARHLIADTVRNFGSLDADALLTLTVAEITERVLRTYRLAAVPLYPGAAETTMALHRDSEPITPLRASGGTERAKKMKNDRMQEESNGKEVRTEKEEDDDGGGGGGESSALISNRGVASLDSETLLTTSSTSQFEEATNGDRIAVNTKNKKMNEERKKERGKRGGGGGTDINPILFFQRIASAQTQNEQVQRLGSSKYAESIALEMYRVINAGRQTSKYARARLDDPEEVRCVSQFIEWTCATSTRSAAALSLTGAKQWGGTGHCGFAAELKYDDVLFIAHCIASSWNWIVLIEELRIDMRSAPPSRNDARIAAHVVACLFKIAALGLRYTISSDLYLGVLPSCPQLSAFLPLLNQGEQPRKSSSHNTRHRGRMVARRKNASESMFDNGTQECAAFTKVIKRGNKAILEAFKFIHESASSLHDTEALDSAERDQVRSFFKLGMYAPLSIKIRKHLITRFANGAPLAANGAMATAVSAEPLGAENNGVVAEHIRNGRLSCKTEPAHKNASLSLTPHKSSSRNCTSPSRVSRSRLSKNFEPAHDDASAENGRTPLNFETERKDQISSSLLSSSSPPSSSLHSTNGVSSKSNGFLVSHSSRTHTVSHSLGSSQEWQSEPSEKETQDVFISDSLHQDTTLNKEAISGSSPNSGKSNGSNAENADSFPIKTRKSMKPHKKVRRRSQMV